MTEKEAIILDLVRRLTPEQKKALANLYNDASIDEDTRVVRVMDLYESIRLKPEIDKAIDAEFEKAAQCLDGIHAPEEGKNPFRELMESLNGRKK